MDLDTLANKLLLDTVVGYLIKTGVIDASDYEDYLQRIKSAALLRSEQDADMQEAVKVVFDEHIDFISK